MNFGIRQFTLMLMYFTTLPNLAAAEEVSEIDYSGNYVMQGKGFGANDSAYTGTCSLSLQGTKRDYHVSCYNQDTRPTYVGKGLARGDTLALFIGDVLQGDHNAIYAGEYLVLYQRKTDGDLTGIWLHAKSSAAGMETLVRKK